VAQHQVNIRIDDADFGLLEAGAYIEHRGIADELRAALSAHVAKLRDDHDVMAVVHVRAARDARGAKDQPGVSSLDEKRSRGR
jgi:hypothetical protein